MLVRPSQGKPYTTGQTGVRRNSRVWEQIGTFAKWELVDERSWLDILASQVVAAWRLLEVPIMAMRSTAGRSAFENFEYLAARGMLWQRRFPDGSYPKGTPRMAELDAADAAREQT